MGYSVVQMIRAIYRPDNGLNEHEKVVMTCLAQHANEQGTCFPSITTVAKECSISRSTALRAIEGLTKKGWIIPNKRNGCVTTYTCRIPATGILQEPVSDRYRYHTETGISQTPDQYPTDTGQPVSERNRYQTETGPVSDRHRTGVSQTPEDTQEVNKYAAAAIYKEHQQQENIVTAFERCFGRFPSSYQLEVFESYIQDGLDERLVIRAMEKAAMDGKGPRYAQGILQDWLVKGIRTVEQAEREEREWRAQQQKVVPLNRPQQKQQKQDLDWTPPYWREYVPKDEPKPKFDILKLDVDKLPLLNAKQRAHLKKLQEEERKRRAAMKDAANGSA